MRLLLGTLIFILIVVIPFRGADLTNAESGPHLIVSSINGTLEIDRPGTIWLDIKNDANTSAVGQNSSGGRQLPVWLQPGYGTNVSDAIGVYAELLPKDARFEMLTGPQIVGSLESGKNRTVEFNLQTDGTAVPGIYPVDILVTYRRLSNVLTTGDPEQPDVTYQYENVSETLPGDVNVVQGPRISVEEVKSSVITGTESELDLVFANSGDLPASDLIAQVLLQSPFSYVDGTAFLGSLDPGHSSLAKFMIKIENGTTPGIYALQMSIDYRDGKILRKEELAALVPVEVKSETMSKLAPAAGALVLLSAAYIIARTYRERSRRKRKRRRR
jgi:hypothetical protein